MKTIGRNDPCPCGSGKKFKQCCIPASIDSSFSAQQRASLPVGPDKVAELCARAHLLRTMGRLDEAVESYRQVLLIRPTFAEAHNSLGNALADQGRLDEAVTCYEQAILINPSLRRSSQQSRHGVAGSR